MPLNLDHIADRLKLGRETSVDVLSDVLRQVRLDAALFFDVRAGERLVAVTPAMEEVGARVMPGAEHVIPFHIMLDGHCYVETFASDCQPVSFTSGDAVIYPRGHAHVMCSRLGDRGKAQLENYDRARYDSIPVACALVDEGDVQLHFVCGYLACDKGPFNPLLEALPEQIVSPRASGDAVEITLIEQALKEGETEDVGSETILARLSELLFLRVLRRYIASLPDDASGWLAGLRDPITANALGLIHRDPARAWTVETLAREVGTSRAVLAERFSRIVGETPMRYLSKWRMQRAATLLRSGEHTVEDVAEQVGYRSDAAFQRAFKSIVGITPGTWRKQKVQA